MLANIRLGSLSGLFFRVGRVPVGLAAAWARSALARYWELKARRRPLLLRQFCSFFGFRQGQRMASLMAATGRSSVPTTATSGPIIFTMTSGRIGLAELAEVRSSSASRRSRRRTHIHIGQGRLVAAMGRNLSRHIEMRRTSLAL
jgi:hypothetical protein